MLTAGGIPANYSRGVEDDINASGAKSTPEGGKLVIPAIECVRF